MNRAFIALFAISLQSCSSPEDDRLAIISQELEQISARDEACFQAERRYADIEGQSALAEWDIAAAESVKDISPEQEWEIRKQLAQEMNLAPSEVDGWEEIYRSRARQAKAAGRMNDDLLKEVAASRGAACKRRSEDARRKFNLERERSKLLYGS